ncbi:hypothetical protein GGX14DRAFT_392779 [Mycena pura]|uniref:Uncharacterized protein n=1 Tax=Mycena pura TaxID=153505 RepID=A0AAD6VMC2_9AGAR|nr:hypothetical protein GGX14DRAFT_392779 [Mycena pura]
MLPDAHDPASPPPQPPHPSAYPPLQLKGEIMDLEFTMDTDHRKRRRNRTTQSCLNCHTSKRKTGLCVYEIDDPALRDDPSIDENTRLRNRIAELESLVRELRGKPHPRWAESSFRDGDPNEKWHSRATKCAPLPKRRGLSPYQTRPPALLPPIKTEAPSESQSQSQHAQGMYRFSASPPPQSAASSAATRYFDDRGGYADYPASGTGSDDGPFSPRSTEAGEYCPCRASPAMAHSYIGLSQALHGALADARAYAPHAGGGAQCSVYRRAAELARMLGGTDPSDPAGHAYDTSTASVASSGTPPDAGSEASILSPLSASASTGSFPGGGAPGSPHSLGSPHGSAGTGGSPGAYHAHPHAHGHAHHSHTHGHGHGGAHHHSGGGGSPGEWNGYGYFPVVDIGGVGMGVGGGMGVNGGIGSMGGMGMNGGMGHMYGAHVMS